MGNKLPTIGVLGCGYLGQQLLGSEQWSDTSWYTVHNHDPDLSYQRVSFSWLDQSTWSHLPQSADCLILTIPPVYSDCEQEKSRLKQWCLWMAEHRPALKCIIYISTTGVYPDDVGVWTEQSKCHPAHARGQLRLDSELVLQRYFQCTAIRAGGIYGPGSNIVQKCYTGQPVFRGNKAVYRIHVMDLVGMIKTIVGKLEVGRIFNAVDNGAASQDELLNWLMLQPAFVAKVGEGFLADSANFKAKRLDTGLGNSDAGGDRIVSNMALARDLGYSLLFPTYQLGLVGFL